MTDIDIEQLKSDIDSFTSFKNSLDNEQVKFPLDSLSQKVAHQDLMIPTGNVSYPGEVSSFVAGVEVLLNGKRYLLHTTL